ncbi:hypothetical protein MXB_580 [Myxobolus squamalis]|nr:hypothetical protein MXB_580 [Myxobolus squamalis]
MNLTKACQQLSLYVKSNDSSLYLVEFTIYLTMSAKENVTVNTSDFADYNIDVQSNSSFRPLIVYENCTNKIDNILLRQIISEDRFILVKIKQNENCTFGSYARSLPCRYSNKDCRCIFERKFSDNILEIERPPNTDLNILALVVGVSLPILLMVIITVLSVFYTHRKQQGIYNPRKEELDGAMEAFDYLKPPRLEHYV